MDSELRLGMLITNDANKLYLTDYLWDAEAKLCYIKTIQPIVSILPADTVITSVQDIIDADLTSRLLDNRGTFIYYDNISVRKLEPFNIHALVVKIAREHADCIDMERAALKVQGKLGYVQ